MTSVEEFQRRMLAREGVRLVDPHEIITGDFMIRIIAPDDRTPSGWTKLMDGVVIRRADHADPLWPLPDYALRPI